jgi:hypothetical protein
VQRTVRYHSAIVPKFSTTSFGLIVLIVDQPLT